MSPDSSSQYINGEYARKNPHFHVEDSAWKASQIAGILARNHVHPTNVCEIGCGAGEVLYQLSRRFPDLEFAHGFEISPQAFAMCRQRESASLRYFNEDLLARTGPAYDLVLCIDVFEHVENPLDFLRRLRGHGKAFVFHVPLDMNVQMVLRSTPILRQRQSVGHLHYFSKDTALATLRDAGYLLEDWCYTPAGLDRACTLSARLARIPRRLCALVSLELTARILGGYSLLVYAR